nr:MAG TPA: hypothetical protein [Caudoviricetes sp.]
MSLSTHQCNVRIGRGKLVKPQSYLDPICDTQSTLGLTSTVQTTSL